MTAFASESSYTRVLFQSEQVNLVYDATTGQYSVRASSPIKAGTLILLEHVVAGSMLEVVSAISVCPVLRSTLYPRKPIRGWAKQRQGDAEEAAAMNAFDFDGVTVIGAAFAMFNHSCKPNCHMDMADSVKFKVTANSKDAIDVRVYGMWTHRAVSSGEELTIDYVNGGGNANIHEAHAAHMAHYGFQCSCDDAYLSQAPRRAQVHKNLGAAFRTRDALVIRHATDAYLDSIKLHDTSSRHSTVDVLTRHVLLKHGFFPAIERGEPLVVTVDIPDPVKELNTIRDRLRIVSKWATNHLPI